MSTFIFLETFFSFSRNFCSCNICETSLLPFGLLITYLSVVQVKEAKAKAEEAKGKAQAALDKAKATKNKVEHSNNNLRDLIKQIRDFLTRQSSIRVHACWITAVAVGAASCAEPWLPLISLQRREPIQTASRRWRTTCCSSPSLLHRYRSDNSPMRSRTASAACPTWTPSCSRRRMTFKRQRNCCWTPRGQGSHNGVRLVFWVKFFLKINELIYWHLFLVSFEGIVLRDWKTQRRRWSRPWWMLRQPRLQLRKP